MRDLWPGTIQVFSPFGSFALEQHGEALPRRFLEDMPRPDVTFGKDHPLAEVTKPPQPDK